MDYLGSNDEKTLQGNEKIVYASKPKLKFKKLTNLLKGGPLTKGIKNEI